jgi:hypothetical protein
LRERLRRAGAEAGEERALLVGGVFRRGVAEVAEGCVEGGALFGREGFAAGICGYADEHGEETLDAAMTVCEQADRVRKITLGLGSNDNRHFPHLSIHFPAGIRRRQ